MSVARGEHVAPALERVVMRCLAKEPEDRFADAGELAAALRAIDESTLGDPGPSRRPPPLESVKRIDADSPTVITPKVAT